MHSVSRLIVTVVVACAAASLAASALYITAQFLLEPVFYEYPPFRIWSLAFLVQAWLLWSLLGLALSLPVSFTLGLMWHCFAVNAGLRSVIAYWLPGAVSGAAIAAAVLGATGLLSTPSQQLGVGWAALLGGFSGLFAWLIRRPDRDAANPATPAP